MKAIPGNSADNLLHAIRQGNYHGAKALLKQHPTLLTDISEEEQYGTMLGALESGKPAQCLNLLLDAGLRWDREESRYGPSDPHRKYYHVLAGTMGKALSSEEPVAEWMQALKKGGGVPMDLPVPVLFTRDHDELEHIRPLWQAMACRAALEQGRAIELERRHGLIHLNPQLGAALEEGKKLRPGTCDEELLQPVLETLVHAYANENFASVESRQRWEDTLLVLMRAGADVGYYELECCRDIARQAALDFADGTSKDAAADFRLSTAGGTLPLLMQETLRQGIAVEEMERQLESLSPYYKNKYAHRISATWCRHAPLAAEARGAALAERAGGRGASPFVGGV